MILWALLHLSRSSHPWALVITSHHVSASLRQSAWEEYQLGNVWVAQNYQRLAEKFEAIGIEGRV